MPAPFIPTPGTPPDPPTSLWGQWQGRVNWIITILIALMTMYLVLLEARRSATPAQSPTPIEQVPSTAPAPAPEVAPVHSDASDAVPVSTRDTLPLLMGAGLLAMPRSRWRLRWRGKGMLALALGIGVLLCGCNPVTPGIVMGADYLTRDEVKYVKHDPALDESARKEKIEIACNLRCLVDLPVIPECPPCPGVQ